MIWKPTTILCLDPYTGEWTKRKFEKFNEFYPLVQRSKKFPGQYDLTCMDKLTCHAHKFIKDKRYTDAKPGTVEYRDFWLLERRKCIQGVFFGDLFIPGSLYMFWNFLPIMNKIEMREMHPDVWDGHLDYALYLELAYLEDLDGACAKARQKGISLYHMARIVRNVWFGNKTNNKIIGYEEVYVTNEWTILKGYRDHLNAHTGWYRVFSPDSELLWEQKSESVEGVIDKKKIAKGNKSIVKGATTKKNYTKAVGGYATEIYATEAGVYQNLKKVHGYVKPNLKQGGVKTGIFLAAGAVGELKDAADLQEFAFNPKAYGIKSIKDVFSGSEEDICYFFPDEFNYTYKDEETGEAIKCYDINGNSNLELARKYLDIEEEKAKAQDETSYKLYKSQHCRTLQDAFDQREDNPFPTSSLKKRQQELLSQKDMVVALYRDAKGKVFHKFTDDVPIQKLNPAPGSDNRGAVIIWDFPVPNPPFGLYYAGVDPIYNLETSTSKSLMAITIYMATHERDGKICQGYPVAKYIGRHKRASDTYQICLDLMEFYNARAAVESNVKDFIEWVIRQGKSKFLMRRSELTIINEIMPNSSIRDEIVLRMEAEFKKRCIEKAIHYMEEPISDVFDLETGESTTIYGVQRIKDKLLILELLRWNPKLNTDTLVSFLLALIAAESNTNRKLISVVKSGSLVQDTAKKSKPLTLGNVFTQRKQIKSNFKLNSPFKR